jgi:hypothetical protein
MRCEDARRLFDAYLDGELAGSQATELGAHRLNCPDCRRALALLEVTGHVLASDRDRLQTHEDFTDRLLACIEAPRVRWAQCFRNILYLGGPLAAAAVIGLAFLGAFDRPGPSATKVLGEKQIRPDAVVSPVPRQPREAEPESPQAFPIDATKQRLDEWLERMRNNMDAMQQLQLTTLQWIEFLKEAQELRGPVDGRRPAGPPETPPREEPPDADSGIEDL